MKLEDVDRVRGYLVSGKVLCPDCYAQQERNGVRIYPRTLSPYSQDCSMCRVVVYTGVLSNTLFK